MKLSVFGDEISDILDEQLEVLDSECINGLDLRNVYGKNVLDLTMAEQTELKTIFTQRNIEVTSIASPIGKYPIWREFAPELERAKTAIKIAKYMNASFVRVFSYYMPINEDSEHFRDEVLLRMKRLTALAEEENVVFVLENDMGVYGDTAERCLDILSHCDSPHLRMAFDIGNFAMAGVLPAKEAYPLLHSYIACVHVRDASVTEEIFLPAGEGVGELEMLIGKFRSSNFSGPVSIEHHLASRYPELTNKERFNIAVKAFKLLLKPVEL